ncbi:LpxI family protein [Tautonia sociabilis]|uniref:LpxI family protein n=1 Tax=Tautonia sociabilis TaxID=2080755 RepID=A0A432MPK2_9BACT|nr:UDP-2,3-diacylglucosamine diphosphatase LpxI [Tautonia sociabilis]RUL89189.1 LpxI family protein [Tautonia sociabilis]
MTATIDARSRTGAGPSASFEGRAVGLLAGSGRFPILFAEAARRQGLRVACVGIRGEAPETLAGLCDSFDVVPVTTPSRIIGAFKRRGVRDLVMAGKVHKTAMYTPFLFWHAISDPRARRVWYRGALRRDKKDDTILLTVIDEFAKDGLSFRSALDFCPELLVNHGVLTRRRPSRSELEDIRFGWHLAKEMGRLDVGQSVAVKDCAAIAVEAIEGTDRCIERAGQLCRSGGWTLVKVAKPQQDMRFDVPTVGLGTIEKLREAGARVLAIEAGKTIVIDRPEVVALADRLGITLVALDSAEVLEGTPA